MKNTAEVSLVAGARSPQRTSAIVPCNVLAKEPTSVLLLDSAMYPELQLDVRRRTLQRVVGVGYSEAGIVICRPQVGHVAFQAQVCILEWPVGEMGLS